MKIFVTTSVGSSFNWRLLESKQKLIKPDVINQGNESIRNVQIVFSLFKTKNTLMDHLSRLLWLANKNNALEGIWQENSDSVLVPI